MEKILSANFVDLYLGNDFADMTGLNGAGGRTPAPPEFRQEIERLREECEKRYKITRDVEFSLNIEKNIFRVTALDDISGSVVYILRRSAASIRPMNSLGLPQRVLAKLLSGDLRGLVLIAGEMGAGKTSTAASLVAEWLRVNGGVGIALEDPIETPLNGEWGKGRCLQVQVSRRGAGYKGAMPLALRSGSSIIMIGEIRNAETAIEVVQASINGHLIVSTMHAGSAPQAIERLQSFASSLPSANSIIADGLAFVIWQSRTPVANANVSRMVAQSLEVIGQHAVRAKIRDGAVAALAEDMVQQASRNTWASK